MPSLSRFSAGSESPTDKNRECPLCACDEEPVVLYRVPTSRIWQAMADELGANFSPEVVATYASPTHSSLVQCPNCDLHFFLPLVPGDARFYGELTSTMARYYNHDKWDFAAALDLVRPGQRLLDVACGAGHFVGQAADKGLAAVGVDTNPEAVAEARSLGRSVQEISLEAFAQLHQGHFDLVTAFQILEHLPNVNPLIQAAVQCLKPGGLLVLTVPNRLRMFRADFEPLDHPPHHLSHWSAVQLNHLAERYGLSVQTIRYEPASMHDSRAVLRQWLAVRLSMGKESIPARLLARLLCGPILYRLYAKSGLLDHWRLWRMSVMAVLQRPAN